MGHLVRRRWLLSRNKSNFSSREGGVKEASPSRKGFLEVETFEPGHKVRDIM